MYDNTQKKMRQNQGAFHNLQSHLAYRYIRMRVAIGHIFYECLVKIKSYQTQKPFIFCDIFSVIGQRF